MNILHERQFVKLTRNLIFLMAIIISTNKLNAQAVWNDSTFVHRSGQQILDGQNNVIRLNGVNLGGWLLWESWIWGGGFQSETTIRTKMQSIIGVAATNAFSDSVHKNYITRADLKKISEECFNVVRVNINHTILEDDSLPYFYKPGGWELLDSILKWCEDYNVYAVLDMHSAPGAQAAGFFCEDPDSICLWQSAANKDRTVQLWKAIANRYKNRGIIAGYDLLGEPNVPNGADLLNLYTVIIDSIRSVDTHHMIQLEGNDYSKDFSIFSSLPDQNVCFHFHFYTWIIPTAQLATSLNVYTNWSNTFNVPLWCGEWGENDLTTLDTTLALLNDPSYKISGSAFWTWKKQWKLIQYPHYAGYFGSTNWDKVTAWIDTSSNPMPTVSEMQQGINEFLTNIKLPNCWFNTTLSDLLKVCPPAGINNLANEKDLEIYPNPFTNNLFIKPSEQIENYELLNSFGQIVWTGKHINNQDFSFLPDGLYILKIRNGNSTQTTKLIKN